MVQLYCDLDNTLIYSYKRDIGTQTVMVERYEGREISFMTQKSHQLLKQLHRHVLFVPTTTRTLEQYQRIDLGVSVPHYALVANGGILLVDGVVDEAWYQTSLQLVAPCQREMECAMALLGESDQVISQIRWISSLFIFTKSANPSDTVDQLREALDTRKVEVLSNGNKVYVVPRSLHKGVALRRLQEITHGTFTIAAGDSQFDIPMLDCAHKAFAPYGLQDPDKIPKTWEVMGSGIFSDELLATLVKEYCPHTEDNMDWSDGESIQ